MRRGQIEIYTDTAGEWRWRWRARNGRITAVSSESYARRGGAVRGARSTVGLFASVVDVEWHDESHTTDPLNDAQESLKRATRNTERAEEKTAVAQDKIDEIRRLTDKIE